MSLITNAINNNQFSPLSVNTTTALTSVALGREVVCTGASSYVLTLPAVAANLYFDIYSQTTSNALVTITPASGTIAGQSTLVIGTGDGVRIMSDGTNWWVLQTWLQPVNFSVTASSGQTITNTSTATITFDTASYNVGSFFNTSTHTFTPLMPGKYQFSLVLRFGIVNSSSISIFYTIALNGTGVIASQFVDGSTLSGIAITGSPNVLLPMNGSSDAVIAQAAQTTGGSLNIANAASIFSGFRHSLF